MPPSQMAMQQWAASIGSRLRQPLIKGDFDVVFEAIRVVVESSSSDKVSALFHYLIQACANNKLHSAAVWCVTAMMQMGVRPDRFAFNIAMDTCAKVGDLNLATKVWKDMVANCIQPNAFSYRIMTNACAQARDGPKAEEWIQRMSAAGFPLCIVSFSFVIVAFAKVGNYAKAEEWYEKASAAGLAADTVIYNSLINASAQGGRPDRAKTWLRKMIASGFSPDDRTYNSLVNASAKIGDVETAEYWIDQMIRSNNPLSVVTYGSVLHACAKACNMDRAEYWMDVMVENQVTPNVVCFNSVLHACAQKGEYARALEWFSMMSSVGVRPSRISYNSIIDAYSRAGELSSAEAWLTRMVTAGFHADRPCYISLFRALRQLSFSRHESSSDDLSSVQAHYLILKAYIRTRKLERIRTHVTQEIDSMCKAQCLGTIYHRDLKEICLASGGVDFASVVFQLLNVPVDECLANNTANAALNLCEGSPLLSPPGSFHLPMQATAQGWNILSTPVPSASANGVKFELPAQDETFMCSTTASDPRFEESSPSDRGSIESSGRESSQQMAPGYAVTGFERSPSPSPPLGVLGNNARSNSSDDDFYTSAMCFSL